MFLSYFDDSSDDRREKFQACGGLVGHESFWDTFEVLWTDATASLSQPFRATQCECQHGQFSKWNKEDCDALMRKLVDVINRHSRLGGFTSVVPISDFKQVFKNSAEYDPFYLAATHVFVNMAHLGALYKQPVKVRFETNTKTNGRCKQIFDELRSLKLWGNRIYLSEFTTGSKSLLPLQAADLVAREGLKMMMNLGNRPLRIPAKRLWQQSTFILWTKEELQEFKEHGGLSDLPALISWLPPTSYATYRPFVDPTRR